MSCRINVVGVTDYIHHETWRSIIWPCKQSPCQILEQTIYGSLCCPIYFSASSSMDLLNYSNAPLLSRVSRLRCTTFQAISKCGLDPICKNIISCAIVLPRLCKLNLDIFGICQNKELSWKANWTLPAHYQKTDIRNVRIANIQVFTS